MSPTEPGRIMTDQPSANDDVKLATELKPTYRSWKKKYKKMMVKFDQVSNENREICSNEIFAHSIINRIATENDRLLGIMLAMNNMPQVPANKRIDISQDVPADPSIPVPDIDLLKPEEKIHYVKSLKELEVSVPHAKYEAVKSAQPDAVADLQLFEGKNNPTTFLSMDDINNYIYEIDQKLGHEVKSPLPATDAEMYKVPTDRDYILNNPVSEYNWLRKHAPKTFLQDGVTTHIVNTPGPAVPGKDIPARFAVPARGRIMKRGVPKGEAERSDDEELSVNRPIKKRRVTEAEELGPPMKIRHHTGIKTRTRKPNPKKPAPEAPPAPVSEEDTAIKAQ